MLFLNSSSPFNYNITASSIYYIPNRMNRTNLTTNTYSQPYVKVFLLTRVQTPFRGTKQQPLGEGYLGLIDEALENKTTHQIIIKNSRQVVCHSQITIAADFRKRQNTIISWSGNEENSRSELAISFRNAEECENTWHRIRQRISRGHFKNNQEIQTIIPKENNLTEVLEQVREYRDVVQEHILNSDDFMINMSRISRVLSESQNKNDLKIMFQITKQLLNNIDERLVEKMFSQPYFLFILLMEKLRNPNIKKVYQQYFTLKYRLPFSEGIIVKMETIIRMNFFKDNIVRTSQLHLNQVINKTITRLSQDVIKEIISRRILQFVAKAKNFPSHATKKVQQLKEGTRLQTLKLNFLTQALNTAKRTKNNQLTQQFLNTIYSNLVIKMIFNFPSQFTLKVLDFFASLIQISPQLLFTYHKQPYTVNNINIYLAKAYCHSQEYLKPVLTIVRHLRTSLQEINLQIFLDSFVLYVFQNCQSGRSLLMISAELIDMIEDSTQLLLVAIDHKVLYKVMEFFKVMPINYKQGRIMGIKILKAVLQSNCENNTFEMIGMINKQAIHSGLFEFCMIQLIKNIRLNNIICSSMLYNLKIIRSFQYVTPYHQIIYNHYRDVALIKKQINPILEMWIEMNGKSQSFSENVQQEEEIMVGQLNQASISTMEQIKNVQEDIKRQRQKEFDQEESQQPGYLRKLNKNNQLQL